MLGSGTYSKVKTINLFGTKYAVKKIRKRDHFNVFLSEISVFKNTSHPNVLNLIDYKVTDYHCSLILPLADRDLYRHVMEGKSFDYENFARQIAAGLYHLEQKNILHCDIKPQNILVFGDKLRITDFGVMEFEPNNNYSVQRDCSTFAFKSPEELRFLLGRNSRKDFKSVTWSFGLVLYYMKSGNLIINIFDYNAALYGITKALGITGSNKIQFDELTDSCLKWKPENRSSMYEICLSLGLDVEEPLNTVEKLKNNEIDVVNKNIDVNLIKDNCDLDTTIYISLALNIYNRTSVKNENLILACLYIASEWMSDNFSYEGIDYDLVDKVLKDLDYDVFRTTEISYAMLKDGFNLELFNYELLNK